MGVNYIIENVSSEHLKSWLESIVLEACRKRFAIQKLRRILGYGDAIFPPVLFPLNMPREECLEMRESAEEDLHLPADIASIVAEMRSPGSLCMAVLDFEPERELRNFKTFQAAASGMLAALGLRDIWWDWFGDSWFGAPVTGEIRAEPAMIYELFERGIRPDFLGEAMLDRYFENLLIDFVDLFPPCDEGHQHLRGQLEIQVARQIAGYFEKAAARAWPDRPDLVFQEADCVRRIWQELLSESPSADECVVLVADVIFRAGQVPPNGSQEETFWRTQRKRHF